MWIGLPRETKADEARVALTPEAAKKLLKRGFRLCVERSCGIRAGYPDSQYAALEGVQIVDTATAWNADLVVKVLRPQPDEVAKLKKGSLLIALMEPYLQDGLLQQLARAGVDTIAMELIPRTSRAQSMDVLSSQANIAGYRAVIEAAAHYGRFFPLMMTSAGSAKPAKVIVLGAGVAGLQAIATAKRLGGLVEAYDIRPEVKEQIQSLGAKVVELAVTEAGSGQGGYAKELSDETKRLQQQLLTEHLKKCDIIISTANIPGRKAPVLITEEAVKSMRPGSVIVDMAAANGGNCPLTVAGQVVVQHGVTLVGWTNYPSMMPTDSSHFYGQNIVSLLGLVVSQEADQLKINLNLKDDIILASLVTYQGDLSQRKGP
jgi:NAD(P) transhydrogenase subunit alpha